MKIEKNDMVMVYDGGGTVPHCKYTGRFGDLTAYWQEMFFKPKRRRKVRCTETGVVYESIKDAAERTKISPNCIGSAASGMAGGYHWEYADD